MSAGQELPRTSPLFRNLASEDLVGVGEIVRTGHDCFLAVNRPALGRLVHP